MNTKELTRLDLVQQSFDCCIQTVRSYGPPMDDRVRQGLINCMQHFKILYEDKIKMENNNGS